MSWYERRWGIEEYFRLLKTGTRIEDRRLRDAEALGKCLVFDAITAWRVFNLDRYARDAPDTLAEEVLTADEMAVIEGVTEAERLRPPRERGSGASRWGRAFAVGWCCWRACGAGVRRSTGNCRGTRCCGRRTGNCKRWCATGRRCGDRRRGPSGKVPHPQLSTTS